ncbi:hypothetical protein OCH7691_02223 [Oceanibacterium hippocampi]|uniref:Uncharacterized protein n=1 Tax=Oceanibacterium hippocampi TaxID=745714 RepID=A0A1Y5SX30_9PROT|nr:hypothetical protein [Oceanibacterium hippocampi]SLN50422.1 hypothetical protein OCH7691_02223 [Oceanibacterium hippocampi]
MEAGYGALYQVFAADQTYRYWKIAVADAAPLAGYFDIGRIVLGPAWKPARNPSWGAQWTWADESRRTRSRGGQSYTDIGARYRVVEFELGYLDETEAFGPAFEIDRVAGLSGDVLAIADEDASLLARRAVWGQIEQATPLVLQRAGKVVKRYRITERK